MESIMSVAIFTIGLLIVIIILKYGIADGTENIMCDHDWIKSSYAHNQEEMEDMVYCYKCGRVVKALTSPYSTASPGESVRGFLELYKNARSLTKKEKSK